MSFVMSFHAPCSWTFLVICHLVKKTAKMMIPTTKRSVIIQAITKHLREHRLLAVAWLVVWLLSLVMMVMGYPLLLLKAGLLL